MHIDCEYLVIDTNKPITIYLNIINSVSAIILPDYFTGCFIDCSRLSSLKIGVSANFKNWKTIPKCKKIQFTSCDVSQNQINNAYSTGCNLVINLNRKFLKLSIYNFNHNTTFKLCSYSLLFLTGFMIGKNTAYLGNS